MLGVLLFNKRKMISVGFLFPWVRDWHCNCAGSSAQVIFSVHLL